MKIFSKFIVFLFLEFLVTVVGSHIRKPRMINAVPTNIEKYPYIAYGGHCTASILHERYILSALHCYKGSNPAGVSFWVGVDDRNNVSAGVQHYAEAIFEASDDAVLFRLSEPIIFNSRAQPIKLNQSIAFVKNETITVAGFGATETGGYSQELREGNFSLASWYGSRISANSVKNGLATGDSGSPGAICRCNDQCRPDIFQIGIAVSAGKFSGVELYEAYFTPITPSLCTWLKEKSNNEIEC